MPVLDFVNLHQFWGPRGPISLINLYEFFLGTKSDRPLQRKQAMRRRLGSVWAADGLREQWLQRQLQRAEQLLEKVPGLKWVFDTANPIFNSDRSQPKPWPRQDPWEFWQHMKAHTAHIHIKDCTWNAAKNDADYNFPGEGEGRVRDILKDAADSGYSAGVSIEPHMVVVFHDTGSTATEEDTSKNFIEYGRRLEKLVAEIKG